MAKYTALDSNNKIKDFTRNNDSDAVNQAKDNHYLCLIKVRSFNKPSPIYTILPWQQKGY